MGRDMCVCVLGGGRVFPGTPQCLWELQGRAHPLITAAERVRPSKKGTVRRRLQAGMGTAAVGGGGEPLGSAWAQPGSRIPWGRLCLRPRPRALTASRQGSASLLAPLASPSGLAWCPSSWTGPLQEEGRLVGLPAQPHSTPNSCCQSGSDPGVGGGEQGRPGVIPGSRFRLLRVQGGWGPPCPWVDWPPGPQAAEWQAAARPPGKPGSGDSPAEARGPQDKEKPLPGRLWLWASTREEVESVTLPVAWGPWLGMQDRKQLRGSRAPTDLASPPPRSARAASSWAWPRQCRLQPPLRCDYGVTTV